jgi:hypothetical protein
MSAVVGNRLDRLSAHVGDLQADLQWRLTVAIASERTRSHDVPRRAVDGWLLVNGERVAAASTEWRPSMRGRGVA